MALGHAVPRATVRDQAAPIPFPSLLRAPAAIPEPPRLPPRLPVAMPASADELADVLADALSSPAAAERLLDSSPLPAGGYD